MDASILEPKGRLDPSLGCQDTRAAGVASVFPNRPYAFSYIGRSDATIAG